MNINLHMAVLALLVAGSISAPARILEMDNERIDKELSGSSTGSIDYDDIVEELDTADGPALIRKFLTDERLKPWLYGQIPRIKDQTARDKLLIVCLRDPSFWAKEFEGLRSPRADRASWLTEAVFLRFSSIRDDPVQLDALVYTFMTPQGREAVAAAYQNFLEAPAGQPGEVEARQAQLLDGIRQAMEKFGTKEFVHPPEPGLPHDPGKPFPFKIKSNEKAAEPVPASPVIQEKVATSSAPPDKSCLLWTVGGAMAIVATWLFILHRQRYARSRNM